MAAGEVVAFMVAVAAVVFMVEAESVAAFTAVQSEADSEGELPHHQWQVPEHRALQLHAL